MTIRLLYVVSHPIQYQAALLRRVATLPGLDFRVAFARDPGPGGAFDPGFGRPVAWDLPLRDGYASDVVAEPAALARRIADADAVWMHGWQGLRMLRALGAARRSNVPVLMRGENTDVAMPDGPFPRGTLKRMLLKWVFARVAAFLCVGTANRNYYRARGVGESRLFDAPYAVDNDFFRDRAAAAKPEATALRRSLGLGPDRPVILFAGKLARRKHPVVLIEAFRRLDRARLGDPALLFVGDGEMRGAVEAAAASDPAVHFLGFRNQTEMPACYALADVFVLAASREPWGLAVNEAMNAGCVPVVSDECGCAADLVSPDCGAVVPAGDAPALARAIDGILAIPDRRAAMARAARAKIATWNFDADMKGLRAALDFSLAGRP